MSMPEFSGNETTDEKLDETRSYLMQMMEALRYLMNNLDSENFNETGLKEITEPIAAEIADVAGNVTEMKITAEGVKVEVDGIKDRNTVTIDSTGLYVTDAQGNSTKLAGDHITSGTIEGVTLISREEDSVGTSLQSVTIENGQIVLKNSEGDTATIAETISGFKISVSSAFSTGVTVTASKANFSGNMNVSGELTAGSANVNGDLAVAQNINSNGAMKLNAGGNASFDAGETLYLQTNGGDINIGNGGNIRLNGTVTVNGSPLATS